jgi:hypothetical protein
LHKYHSTVKEQVTTNEEDHALMDYRRILGSQLTELPDDGPTSAAG